PEDDLHLSVRDCLSIAIAAPGVASNDGVMWFTVEMRNARDAIEGAKRKRKGVVAGVPDIWVFYRGTVLAIELKRRGGGRSKAQRDLHAQLNACEIPVLVCRSVEE